MLFPSTKITKSFHDTVIYIQYKDKEFFHDSCCFIINPPPPPKDNTYEPINMLDTSI